MDGWILVYSVKFLFFPNCRVLEVVCLYFTGSVVKVRELDWLKDNLCTGTCSSHIPFDFVVPGNISRPLALWP